MFERIALFGVAISFKSRTRLVAFSVTRLLKSGCQSRKYSLMHQAKWTESQRRNWTIPWKTWLREISWHPRDIFSQYSLELETTILGEEGKNFLSWLMNCRRKCAMKKYCSSIYFISIRNSLKCWLLIFYYCIYSIYVKRNIYNI